MYYQVPARTQLETPRRDGETIAAKRASNFGGRLRESAIWEDRNRREADGLWRDKGANADVLEDGRAGPGRGDRSSYGNGALGR